MAEFTLTIAGHAARISSLFESTPQYFKNYLAQDVPEFSIRVTREDLAFEQKDLLEEALRDGFKPRTFTDPFLERAAIQRQFAEFLFDREILLCHGSAVAVDGRGYLFTAPSGTGKSTHTRLWMQVFDNRAQIVNDDKPFLELNAGGVWLHGSPWSGKHGLDANVAVPLAGICLLHRGAENRIWSSSPEALLPVLQKACYAPLDAGKAEPFSQLVAQLAQKVPLWEMACNKNPHAAQMAYDAMSGQRIFDWKKT